MNADLPPGSYVVFRIAAGTTAESLAAFLRDHGLAIESRMIAFREEGANSCLISIPSSALFQMLAWVDGLLERHYQGLRRGMPQAQLRALEVQITNLDSRIQILPRIVAVVTSVLYRYYFLGWDSVQACNGIPGLKPQAVRQMCFRARHVWDRLNGGRLYAIGNGEFVQMAPTLRQRKSRIRRPVFASPPPRSRLDTRGVKRFARFRFSY